MNQTSLQRQSSIAAAFRVIIVCTAIVFLFAAALHTGAFGVPQLVPAMIVEGACGIGFVFLIFAVFTRQTWAQTAAITVHIVAVVGVLAGFTALVRSPGLDTPINVALHVVMIVLLVAGLSLIAIPGTRETLHR